MLDILDKTDERIVMGGKDITDALKTELRKDVQTSVFNGHINQKNIAKFHQDNVPKMIDGLGEIEMSVDEDMFHAARMVYGEDCWQDPDFRKFYRKLFPGTKVKNRSSIITGYTGNGNTKHYV